MARSSFWLGCIAGSLGATGVMLLLRCADGACAGQFHTDQLGTDQSVADWSVRARRTTGKLRLKRESPEAAGDPALLSSIHAGTPGRLERPGGAPGPLNTPETLEVPGHPGQTQDHANPSAPVTPSTRALDLNQA